jgi:GDP-L-fucose synthase
MPEQLPLASRIYVAGHTGLAGSAIVRRLRELGYENLVLRSRAELDLRSQDAVECFFGAERPENAARPAEFLYDNLAMETNVIHSAWKNGVRKLLFMGSSCIYPKLAPQPMREDSLLTGALEPTNEAYAIAKIAGLKMAAAYRVQYGFRAISLMPSNLYGPGDQFDLENSHVLPALIRRFHDARISGLKQVTLWGTGTARREFLHSSDLASAAVFAMEHYDALDPLNVGSGEEISIAELAEMIARVAGYHGEIRFDSTKPDGTPRKLLDSSRIRALGWKPQIALEEGITSVHQWYVEHAAIVAR